MKRMLALMAGPVLVAALLLAGSAGFTGHSTSDTGLNTKSDTIDFAGMLVVSGNAFTIHSTDCTLQDEARMGADGTTFPWTLAAAGTLNPATGTAKGTVVITGPDGTITFQQTATRGCATGTGFETDSGPTLVPLRIEGRSSATPVSAHILTVTGTISVYEAGGSPIGIDCLPG